MRPLALSLVLTALACGGRSTSSSGDTSPLDASTLTDASSAAESGPDAPLFGDGAVTRGCIPPTCASLGYDCGQVPDVCEGILDCGTCTGADFCGGGGFDRCGPGVDGGADAGVCPGCSPATCASLGYDCGVVSDVCGALLDCGTCKAPAWCGGGGFNVCGHEGGSDAGACVPRTCAQQKVDCGQTGDGCGNLLVCGTCSPPDVCCGGDSLPGHCGRPGPPMCTPLTCAQQNLQCGPASDGCGNLLECGTCMGALTCGGGGQPGQCGGR